uniref:Uncharacterized protein n=1 Tax=Arundo donax TaxID=35708 RepID=A0A0A9FPZ0_ARUDO
MNFIFFLPLAPPRPAPLDRSFFSLRAVFPCTGPRASSGNDAEQEPNQQCCTATTTKEEEEGVGEGD